MTMWIVNRYASTNIPRGYLTITGTNMVAKIDPPPLTWGGVGKDSLPMSHISRGQASPDNYKDRYLENTLP